MSSTDAANRALAAAQNDKGRSGGIRVSKRHVSGSAGVRVWKSKGHNWRVGAAVSARQNFRGGKPKFAISFGIHGKF